MIFQGNMFGHWSKLLSLCYLPCCPDSSSVILPHSATNIWLFSSVLREKHLYFWHQIQNGCNYPTAINRAMRSASVVLSAISVCSLLHQWIGYPALPALAYASMLPVCNRTVSGWVLSTISSSPAPRKNCINMALKTLRNTSLEMMLSFLEERRYLTLPCCCCRMIFVVVL